MVWYCNVRSIARHYLFIRKTKICTCNLDDSSNPVDFARQDCVGVQDLHLHPNADVIPLGTHGNLRVAGHTLRKWSSVNGVQSQHCCTQETPRIVMKKSSRSCFAKSCFVFFSPEIHHRKVHFFIIINWWAKRQINYKTSAMLSI